VNGSSQKPILSDLALAVQTTAAAGRSDFASIDDTAYNSSDAPIVGDRRDGAVTAIWVSIGAALAAFVAGLTGLSLQRFLPEPHTSDRSRDMILAIVGLVSLLLALVLGIITGSAYNFYTNQKQELETIAAHTLQLDIALAEFGPEARQTRELSKTGMERLHNMFWGRTPMFDYDPSKLRPDMIANLKAMDAAIAALNPQTPLQKQAIASATADAALIKDTRLLIALQLKSPVSWPLVTVVVIWSILLFCGFGVLSRFNATTVAALGFGAFAVGSALFLILELSQPYTGLFRVPAAALEESLEAIGN
jgi:hypothetical protein